jgi:cysteine desulfurase/selenocysteine lyase
MTSTTPIPAVSDLNGADPIDSARVKADFPLLVNTKAGAGHEKLITYLDSAATAQKPQVVIDAVSNYYETTNANVARGVYELAEASTNAMENARRKVAKFIKAPSADEIVFTKNATESLNLVARSMGRRTSAPGDAVVLTQMEHHANIVPWQILRQSAGFEIRWISVDETASSTSDLDASSTERRCLSVSAMSNVLGTITPVRQITDAAHAAGALVCVDACQYVPHLPTDVVEMGADFVVLLGHKMVGPTGVGVLWGRTDLLDAMPPFLGGGGMIENVTQDGFTTARTCRTSSRPARRRSPRSSGSARRSTTCRRSGWNAVREHEVRLTSYAMRTLAERFGDKLDIHGPSEPALRGGVFSLELAGVHPHDLSQVLDEHGVCVRAGHHCAKPLMKVLGVGATARASVYIYNDEADVDALADALEAAESFFAF